MTVEYIDNEIANTQRISQSKARLDQGGWSEVDTLPLGPDVCEALANDCAQVFQNQPRWQMDGRSPALLKVSLAARTLLDSPELGNLIVKELELGDTLLSECNAIRSDIMAMAGWRRTLMRVRRSISTRAFRPGVELLVPTAPCGGSITLIECGHLLSAHADINCAAALQFRYEVPSGRALLLEAGMPWRLDTDDTGAWLHLAFVRGWMKPEFLYCSALDPLVLASMGDQSKAWCGGTIGYPTSIKEFLDIEEAAITGRLGRVKGSGI